MVHPAERRHGLGLALLRHAAGRARGARAFGAQRRRSRRFGGRGFRAISRRRNRGWSISSACSTPGKLEEGRLARLRGPAERAAAGYSLVSWTGLVPEEFIEQVADLYTALNDAPHDPETEPEVWDAQRVRERINDLRPHFGMRGYAVAARDDATGELAALTEIAVDPADPGWGHQMFTVVTRKHRGHRLGLLVKIAMLELLATAEPQLERIVTWNAQANEHMIAVNEALGYTILGQPSTWFRLDVAAALGLYSQAGLVAAGRLLSHRDHADDLGLGHAEVDADGQRGVPLRFGERAVRHGDADHLGQVPLPGLDGELRPDLVQGRADRPRTAA